MSAERFETVCAVVAETLDVDRAEIDADTCSATLPLWDSLAHLMIINAVEKRFDIVLPRRNAYTVRNVGELAGLVDRQLATGA